MKIIEIYFSKLTSEIQDLSLLHILYGVTTILVLMYRVVSVLSTVLGLAVTIKWIHRKMKLLIRLVANKLNLKRRKS